MKLFFFLSSTIKSWKILAIKQQNSSFQIQYNTIEQNLTRLAVLIRFRDSFGLKKAKIKKRKIPILMYLSVQPIDLL